MWSFCRSSDETVLLIFPCIYGPPLFWRCFYLVSIQVLYILFGSLLFKCSYRRTSLMYSPRSLLPDLPCLESSNSRLFDQTLDWNSCFMYHLCGDAMNMCAWSLEPDGGPQACTQLDALHVPLSQTPSATRAELINYASEIVNGKKNGKDKEWSAYISTILIRITSMRFSFSRSEPPTFNATLF